MSRGLLDAVGRVLGAERDSVDRVETAARVAWSAVVEPGDAVAGELLAALGPERALGAVLLAADGDSAELLDGCVEAGVAGAEDPDAFGPALESALPAGGRV